MNSSEKQTNFIVKRISEHIYRLEDFLHVFMYLIVGRESACLLDTGWGFSGLREQVERLCHLPVKVILTHGHSDHASGTAEFEQVYMNPLDIPIYKFYQNPVYKSLIAGCDMEKNTRLQPIDNSDFLPLYDGDIFDLGGITVEMMEVPGHTKGFMMALVCEERTILFGDGCGPGTLLIEDFSADIETYKNSLLRIKKREQEYDTVLRNHGTGISHKSVLDCVLNLCDMVLAGQDDKIVMKGGIYDIVFRQSRQKIYSAKEYGEDALNDEPGRGNIIYRADKIIRPNL